ncbi:hypothetical protein AALK14_20050 [Butyricimonas hominis]|uniref:hypothetical protein n=1 Tax=Butyricimonas TaxID=574697 RepID=UPI0035175810
MEKKENKKGSSGKEEVDVKKHLTPEEDEKLREAYVDALGEILENDDDDARDNLANYMDEIKEESEALGTELEDDLEKKKK